MTDVLREGMRAAINCQVMEGDRPISFRWERDGRTITSNAAQGTIIRTIDEYSSSLIIDRITSAHSGNYTCIASNVAGSEKFVVPLTVNGKSNKTHNKNKRFFDGFVKFHQDGQWNRLILTLLLVKTSLSIARLTDIQSRRSPGEKLLVRKTLKKYYNAYCIFL